MKYSLRLLFVSLFLISCGNDAKEDKASNSNNKQGDVDISGIWLLKNEPSFLVLNIDGVYAFAEFWDDRDGESGSYSWKIDSREECDDSGDWHVKGNELCMARCEEPEDSYCTKFELTNNQLKIYYDGGPEGAQVQIYDKVQRIKFHKESTEKLDGSAGKFLGVWLHEDDPSSLVLNNDGLAYFLNFWDDRDGESGDYHWTDPNTPDRIRDTIRWWTKDDGEILCFQPPDEETLCFPVELSSNGDYLDAYSGKLMGRIKSIKIKE